jgi:long-subunit acyl-CoA synthetase (AMP-forming)
MVFVRPLSGGGALGVVGDVLRSEGPDSYAGRLVSVMAGSTETTFYVLAVYMGAVGITRYRHALPAGLLADLAGYERIRRFSLLAEEFSQDGGELTPTQKIRRRAVEQKYRAVIEAMYAGTAQPATPG